MNGDRPVLPREAAHDRLEGLRALDHPDHVVFADHTVLCQGTDGMVTEPRHGLFDEDARLLCRYAWTVDGDAPHLISSAIVDDDRWLGTFIAPLPGGDAEGPRLPQDAIGIRIERIVGPAMLERWSIVNHSAVAATAELRLEVAADLIDILRIRRTGEEAEPLDAAWTPTDDAGRPSLLFERTVRGPSAESRRATRVRLGAPHRPDWDGTALTFHLRLGARQEWKAEVSVDAQVHGEWRSTAGHASRGGTPSALRARERAAWRRERTRVCTEPPMFGEIVEQSIEDLFSLRDRELEAGDGWVLAAGMPSYTGLFGRDVLTSGWQAALAGAEPLRGAIEAVAATQAETDDPWRDAEPGKLIHEQRRGPLGEAGLSPRDAYYGSHTVPAMFTLALSEAWHWTGDDGLLHRYADVAERGAAWATRQVGASRTGFLAYRSRSSDGLRNQAWKDSDEAIREEDGSIVEPPIATVEEQAFHIIALERLAEIRLALGDEHAAERHLVAAARLRRRWHAAFWQEDLGFYAMALRDDGGAVRSIGSNAGHALGVGAVPRDLASRVMDRLLAPDLFSGWGVRTLSVDHPSYQPFAYHLGAVWPVENATFCLGAKRYGLDDAVERVAEALVAAAAGSPGRRLPEALSGLPRAEWPVPVPYPSANAPQAWSASALVQLVQTLVGAYPFAPARVLALVRPRLPEWVDVLSIDRLRVGDATASLRFVRQPDGSARHSVVEQSGRLFIVEVPPPQAVDDLAARDALAAWALEHAPGQTARLIRIAMGLETEHAADEEPVQGSPVAEVAR